MSYKRESLEKLLALILEILSNPENAWFKERLTKSLFKLNNTPAVSENFSIETKINLIQEYLYIDIQDVIDYSVFKEPSREQLLRDNIEMCRYQKGTPNHKINFGEYCRYAHLQAEEMINYYWNIISNFNLDFVDNTIKKHVSTYSYNKKPSNIHQIAYSIKLSVYNKINNLPKNTYDMLWFINDLRNELSHRNSLADDKEDKIMSAYEKKGFAKNTIDFKKISQEELSVFNKGKFIINKRNQDFKLIKTTIEVLKRNVEVALHKPLTDQSVKSTFGAANPVLDEIKKKLEK